MQTRGASGIVKPNPKYVMAAATVEIPRSPRVALTIPAWKTAMERDLKALQENQTWTHLDTKWVFKVK